MTQPPPPYGGYPGDPSPAPAKYRPSGWWFALGGGFVLAAVVAGIALFVWTLVSFLDTDAKVAADGEGHAVVVSTDGDRMLWFEDGAAQDCRVVDQDTGQEIRQRPVSGDFTRADGDGSWQGATRFDPGTGKLAVTCRGGGTVLIGALPEFGSLAMSILLTIAIPLVLGLIGGVILLVTGILFAVRPARPKA